MRPIERVRSVRIAQVKTGKGKYLSLLLLGDEQEALIRGYLDRGELFVLEDGGEAKGVCVVTREGTGIYELQNIAVDPRYQRQGVGRAMVEFLWERYPDLEVLRLGTGDSSSTLGFYRALGFRETGREAGYFTRYYDHPIYEDGKLLTDRVLLEKRREPGEMG